ncbi:MAG: imidazole glycerol phosphate synthase subunit HisH [Phycisphaerae bacterium]|nr:imidazole glycerol phosphate synthase subunit HisH [Phycisphaerae bacterium]
MIAVIDYGMGNLRSVQKALQRVGGRDVRVVTAPAELSAADKVVLPGVAAFGDAMARLRGQHLVETISRMVRRGVPYLGFCLGMQLLFEVGHEGGEHRGLGLLEGQVRRFDFSRVGGHVDGQPLRVPHMGWNRILHDGRCPMLRGIPGGTHVYFAHSYHPVTSPAIEATATEYGYRFTSSVWRDNIFATQFHPEKSQSAGLKLLQNFVEL